MSSIINVCKFISLFTIAMVSIVNAASAKSNDGAIVINSDKDNIALWEERYRSIIKPQKITNNKVVKAKDGVIILDRNMVGTSARSFILTPQR